MRINLFFIAITLFTSCAQQGQENKNKKIINNFEWLAGEWINNQDSNAIFHENWSKISAQKLTANSYILKLQDTVFFETIELETNDSATLYKVSVMNQNGAEAVSFKLVSNENDAYIFENKQHDFPQRIIYQYKAPDTLNAWIEGIVKGEIRKETFLMWRKR
jgi:hypothetical protein